jgi:poly(A) polymerase
VVQFGTDWHADAARRDFTMNALYAGHDGTLYDPMTGLQDCLAGQVRFIGDPDSRIAEDRLRVFRFFRFSASHGQQVLDPDGYAACARAAGDLSGLSAERVGAEMLRMLKQPKVAKTLAAMAAKSVVILGEESLLFLAVYEHLARQPVAAARLALIMLETGAGPLRKYWRLSNALMKDAADLAGAASLISNGREREAVYRFEGLAAHAIPVAAVLDGWSLHRLRKEENALARIKAPDFPISGRDLIARGFEPGPAIGAELARLERAWIDSGFALDREDLIAELTTRRLH